VFKNLQSGKMIKLHIEILDTDELCPCVCLCGINDSVSIFTDFNSNEEF